MPQLGAARRCPLGAAEDTETWAANIRKSHGAWGRKQGSPLKATSPTHMQSTADIVLLDFCDAFGFSFLQDSFFCSFQHI